MRKMAVTNEINMIKNFASLPPEINLLLFGVSVIHMTGGNCEALNRNLNTALKK
jgi:hypothetical protein